MRIRHPGWRQFGSGIRDGKKVRSGIRDKHPGSATLLNVQIQIAFLQKPVTDDNRVLLLLEFLGHYASGKDLHWFSYRK
jgi:hypothetical protein